MIFKTSIGDRLFSFFVRLLTILIILNSISDQNRERPFVVTIAWSLAILVTIFDIKLPKINKFDS